MRRRIVMTWRKGAGIFLLALCGAGFLTVADDLDHKGELLAVGSLGVAGVALLVLDRKES